MREGGREDEGGREGIKDGARERGGNECERSVEGVREVGYI